MPPLAPWLLLAGIWLLLNLTVNVTFPAHGDWLRWCQPAWEVTAIVLVYAWRVAMNRPLSMRAHLAVVMLLLSFRAFRFVDGVYVRYFHREFRAAFDAPLVPQSVRLLIATDGVVYTLVTLGLGLVSCGAFGWLLYRVLRAQERTLAQVLRPRADAGAKAAALSTRACCAVGVFAVVAPSQSSLAHSVPARLASEVRFAFDLPELRQHASERFERASLALARSPHDLSALAGRDVSIIVIESYGRGALDSHAHRRVIDATLSKLGERLSEHGRTVASTWLIPPTYGGGSWFAHATLATGIKVWSPLEYELLLDSSVVPLSRFMSKAGYHTLNVMPGTTRAWTKEGFFAFDEKLYAADFAYQGPWFSWGRFPDQYVLDQVRRRSRRARPSYKEIKLVSSHAPWRELPPVVEDWDRIGNGALYHALPTRDFGLRWSNLEGAHPAYMASIGYALTVVGEYVRQFEAPEALIVILGDHQPVREASESDKWHVPLHMAGPEDLVGRFRSRGFHAGLRPPANAEPLPMEDFLLLFLDALSTHETADRR